MTRSTTFILLAAAGVVSIAIIWAVHQRRLRRSNKAREQAEAKQKQLEEEVPCLKTQAPDPQEDASPLEDAKTNAENPDSSHHADFRGDENSIRDLLSRVERATDANPDQKIAHHTEPLPLTVPFPSDDEQSGPRKDNEDVELNHDSVTPLQPPKPPSPKWSTEPTCIAPIDRGGRPRESVSDNTHRVDRSYSHAEQSLKPEIVCWKHDRQWIVGVELPETYLVYSDLEVNQSGVSLVQDDQARELWWLRQTDRQVHVCRGEEEIQVEVSTNGILLFKLDSGSLQRGRRVNKSFSGWYLAIVANVWQRNERESGPAPVVPEPTSLPDYQAHFFALTNDGTNSIAFQTPAGPMQLRARKPGFVLRGKKVEDDSEDGGPIFTRQPPQIRALDLQAWSTVHSIVVGEEGSGRDKWREEFKPDPTTPLQTLPEDLSTRGAGWYFLRIYDLNTNLLDSFDFRFVNALHGIEFDPPPPLPQEGGHQPVHIVFLHDAGCTIEPDSSCPDRPEVETISERTVVRLPAAPNWDKTLWHIRTPGSPSVEVVLLTKRVWWSLSDEATLPGAWGAECVEVMRTDFRAASHKALWLHLPRPGWIERVSVGFEQREAREYRVKVKETTVTIPLRDFGDALNSRSNPSQPLRLWICHEGQTCTASLCQIRIQYHCKGCDFTAPTENSVVSHIETAHLSTLFRNLTYAEMQELSPELPHRIYRCGYCPEYVQADHSWDNPTDAIITHIQTTCTGVRHTSPPPIRFRVITDLDELRENVISSLPHIHRCTLCGHDLRDATQENLRRHLRMQHRDTLVVVE